MNTLRWLHMYSYLLQHFTQLLSVISGFLFPLRIVVLAGDTLPIDVYCHLPVMCEDRSLPYAYIPSKVVTESLTLGLTAYFLRLSD